MSSSPRPSSRERLRSRFASCACAEASSDASGSSRTITDGSAASARAIAIALALAAGELVREPLRRGRRAGRRARSSSPHARRARRARGRVDPVADLRADRPPRVERRVRVLEDHLQPDEAARPRAARQRRDGLALEDDACRPRSARARPPRAPASTCRSPTRRRGRRPGRARRRGSLPRPRARSPPPRRVVVDDDVVELERAHAVLSGSTGQASRREPTGDERRHVGRCTSRSRTRSAD